MANIIFIDIITVCFIAVAAYIGYKAGFINTLFKFGHFIVASITAAVAYPLVSAALINSPVGGGVQTRVSEFLGKQGSNAFNTDALPGFLADPINAGVDSTTQAIAGSLTQLIITILSIIIVFLVVKFGLMIVLKLLNIVASLPVISSFNKTGGLIIGAINGVVLVYLILAVAMLFVSSPIVSYISSAGLTGYLYENNLLLKLIIR